MSKVRSKTALTIPLIAMLLVVPGWTHAAAAAPRTDLRESPLGDETAPAGAVRAWVVAIARLLVGAIEGAVRVVAGRLALFYHIGVIIVSAAIAATLPFTFAFLARRLLASWSAIENERVFLVAAEIGV